MSDRLKGTVRPKLKKIHVFPFTCSAVYPSTCFGVSLRDNYSRYVWSLTNIMELDGRKATAITFFPEYSS